VAPDTQQRRIPIVDAQREKLNSQLNELEAAERVLARYSDFGQLPALCIRFVAIAHPGKRLTILGIGTGLFILLSV
jgi:hypothetical protein